MFPFLLHNYSLVLSEFPERLGKLFVAGGYDDSSLTNVEIVDMTGSGQTCVDPAPLPHYTSEPSILKTKSGNPLVCGGNYDADQCLEYQLNTNEWVDGPSMDHDRRFTPTALLAHGDYWVVSGYYSAGKFNSEVYVSDRDEFVSGPSVPNQDYNDRPCAARISDQMSFFANQIAYTYDWSTATLTPTPTPMPC